MGSVLNQADDVSLAVRRLVFGEMKVCGITRADDATRAALEDFSAAGVVLAKRSPRAVTPEGLAVLSNEIKERTKALGLTMPVTAVVDTDETDVLRAIASPAATDAFTPLQIHGDVTDADLEGLRVLFPGKALHLAAALPEDPVALAEAARRLEGLLERGLADRIVVDGTSDGLAGGLTPENARTAAAAVRRGSTRTRASSRRRVSRIRAFWPSSRAPCGDAPDADPKTEHTELHRTELEKGISIMLLNPYFGQYGGQFVPELLLPALDQLERAYVDAKDDPAFRTELDRLLTTYAGRPTPLTRLTRLTEGTKTTIYLKREDLLHGGAHKTNQVLGQALLTKRMAKTRVIAETGAGQHGVATALASALFGFKCRIYMGAKDVERQKPNVFRMELMGAKVVPVTAGSGTLKEACNAALRNWAESFEDTHYMLGTAAGPHPFPTIVREFQKVIGEEARAQFAEAENGLLPDAVIACVGGGSNAIGLFTDFRPFEDTRLIGVEPAGMGIASGKHGVTLGEGQLGIFFGARSYNMQTPEGQINESYSISAGLDFPSVGPEHAHLKYTGRAEYVSVTDREALGAFLELSLKEGIIPALESSHALAYALKMARAEPEKEQKLVVNLSGRGDKDIFQVAARLEADGCLKDGRLSSDALGAYAD